jgi:hypothetical protein
MGEKYEYGFETVTDTNMTQFESINKLVKFVLTTLIAAYQP